MTSANLTFDETKLRDRLASFPCWKTVAFAACCSERLLPAFTRYSEKARLDIKSSKLYLSTLEQIWSLLLGCEASTQSIEEMEQRCLREIPTEDDAWVSGEPYAQDAASAVTYALRTWMYCNPKEAVWSALSIYNSVDNFVTNISDKVTSLQHGGQQILCHALIQRELTRQNYDLELLETSSVQQMTINVLRSKARVDALTVFEE